MPGGSPYFQRAEDIEALYRDLDALFAYARSRFRGATLAEFAASIDGSSMASAGMPASSAGRLPASAR